MTSVESVDAASTLFLACRALESGESVDVSSDNPTGPWVEPMKRAKATDPRNGLPSWNQLGILAGLSTSTVTAMISGRRKTSTDTIEKVAAVLNVLPSEVREWLELDRKVQSRYSPPPEADLLTDRQRKALTNLIRSIVADEQEGGTGNGKMPAEKSDEDIPVVDMVSVEEFEVDPPPRRRQDRAGGS